MVSALLLALTCLPYVVGQLAQSPDLVFGGRVFNRTDYAQDLARIIQGWRGDWQARLPATSEPHDPSTIYMLYHLLGHLARLFLASLWAIALQFLRP